MGLAAVEVVLQAAWRAASAVGAPLPMAAAPVAQMRPQSQAEAELILPFWMAGLWLAERVP